MRVKPFAQVSYPSIPSFDQFVALVSLHSTKTTASEVIDVLEADRGKQALGILEVAESAVKEARTKWEQISKTDPASAKCLGFEEWWRTSIKSVLKSCIAANIAIATAKTAVANARGTDVAERLKVEILGSGKSYHPWWIVPKITAK